MVSGAFGINAGNAYLEQAMSPAVYEAVGLTAPIQIDYIGVAPYLEAPTDSSLLAGYAGVAASVPGTLQYGTPVPWSFQMCNDLLKHMLLYSQNWVGTGQSGQTLGVGQSIVADMAAYNAATGYNCQLIGYEGSFQVPIPSGISVMDSSLCGKITQDVIHSPSWYQTQMAYYQALQNSGMVLMNPFGLYNSYSAGELWALAQYVGQPAGYGEQNRYWLNTGVSQLQNNQSPGMQAWQDWAGNANSAPLPAVTAVSPLGGANGVSRQTKIAVTFSVPMSSTTISMTVTTATGYTVPGALTYSLLTQTAFFSPLLPLASGTLYSVNVNSGTSALGANLPRSVSWSFRTQAAKSARWFPGLRRLSS